MKKAKPAAADAQNVGESRVAVIGAGNVGAATAYALLQSSHVREIVLVDSDREKAEGEAMDLSHAAPLGPPVAVSAGGYGEAARSAIAVVTAGAGGKPGESRLDLLERNAPIVRECVTELRENGFDGVLLVVSNPADVLTHVAREASGLPAGRVVGSGTLIDTARLRQMLGETLKVEPRSVHAYVLGEHGDSEIAAFSCAHVAGVPLAEYAKTMGVSLDYDDILRRVREAAPEVVKRKGHTAFAIASSVTRICEAILRDERAVLPVSARLTGQYGGIKGVYLGTPCVVGAGGVEQIIELPLSGKERAALRASADVLAEAIASLTNGKGD
ncbi:MAG TPA: L-lactate dehydrogenase [Armatimonadaceae bacterium]|nr:L-lactate dehydrogenase [Armatimonadaceae bacterium]